MKAYIHLILFSIVLSVNGQTKVLTSVMNNYVEFQTSDAFLSDLYQAAERVSKNNLKDFAGRTVLIEGGGYNGLWLETQPMGGEMNAKRNWTTAVNNVLFFIDYQRSDGRFPGMIYYQDGIMHPLYSHLQGYYFPYHALNLFYWDKKRDAEYLHTLYQAIEAFDTYLWKYRDSDGNGCLETWCVWDTGEDESNRFSGTKLNAGGWSGEIPPEDPVFPVESMDMMSYSYDARVTLAKISALIGNGLEKEWNNKAQAVREKLQSYLWDDKRGACYDRNRSNERMPALIHNNLRAMYFGSFTQSMSDRFVKEHLMNPREFLTPFPLPSIAVNDTAFRNHSNNDWSGQPEGLTYQRTIRALENYGYFSEITVIGEKLIDCVGKRNTFPQQIDPFTGEFSEADKRTEYGPMALSVLEYISRLYGVHIQFDEIYWGALGRDGHEISYTQHWDGDTFSIQTKDGTSTGYINEKEIFRVTDGVRVVTDWKGKVTKVINIKQVPLKVKYHINGKEKGIQLKPNQILYLS
ncbi:MAG: Cytoplasmic trehalase [Candidatus Ordinivivax streblomastigis]|uniref:Cytoplasmic trehalase n=1 Tax=Candidatus Ordinivivax streblomastigis TaxID=2540710 RepID=A0A5M8NUR6_9BACT|nr:MAG: Cytoplasmic trehalase [Candidatus Ordinivivax streblomastigis]